MVRTYSFLLGLGLAILWLAGITSYAPLWFTWLTAIAAICAFGGSLMVDSMPPVGRRLGPLALSLGLFGLWIAGLLERVPPWQIWWTFFFAAAFLLLFAATFTTRTRAA